MMGTGKKFEAVDIGLFNPKMTSKPSLSVGEVGYFVSNIKTLGDVRIGDTMTIDSGDGPRCSPGTASRGTWSSRTSTRRTRRTTRPCATRSTRSR